MRKIISEGFHPSIDNQILKKVGFNDEEIRIIKSIAYTWYITKIGEINLSKATSYKYVLIKPTNRLQEMFNIEKELGVIFSDYDDLQPRTLDAFDVLHTELATWRIEKICSILISRDLNVVKKINGFIKSDVEARIIIPFGYQEFEDPFSVGTNIENRFREHFYDRDLFAFSSPLKKDVYFFGRKDLIHTIINRHKSNENSGLFGLRKTGKTSVIYGIKRALERDKRSIPIIIDCQDTSFNQREWYEALYFLCLKAYEVLKELKIKENKKLNMKEPVREKFTKIDASLETEKYLTICKTHMKDTLFFIFDEIENISIRTSAVEHWKNGTSFIPFWQTLRSLFQRKTDLLSYLIIGTNPYSIEQPTINGTDNPIYNFIKPEYIQGFTVSDTKEMVNKLGLIMGLEFDETIFSKLTEDFGGHPFLIRQVCSIINQLIVTNKSIKKPASIDRNIYYKAKDIYMQKNSEYIEMILTVLNNYYEDEYEMLKYLAIGNTEDFYILAEDKALTNHLLGYGILYKNHNIYDFKIDLIKKYILDKNRYKNKVLTMEEKWREISDRRNRIEPKLRNLVKMILLSNLGAEEARKVILDILGSNRKRKYDSLSFIDLFNPSKGEIYFLDLQKIINKKWELFKNIFQNSKKSTFENLEKINQYRNDAHAKDIDEDDFILFRIAISKLEEEINRFFS